MKPSELFKLIRDTEFITIGDAVDFVVKVFDDEKIIRLLFEESTSFRDWKNNFNFPIKPYKNQKNILWFVRGWAKAYKSANDEIMENLINSYKVYPDYKIEICGWSYGGAISLLAAEEFYYRTKIKPDVITFGAPKALFGKKTKNYVMSCCNKVIQYAHQSDIVPYYMFFPGYTNVNKTKLGKFNFFNLFKPKIYHRCYGNEDLYL